jgi:glycosyltransferase involved in cell wall biosynthesis
MPGDDRSPTSPRVCVAVVVNGGVESALGVRARGLFGPLSLKYDVHYLYREAGKMMSAGAFLRSLARLRPAVVYVLDTAFSGASAAILARRLFRGGLIVDTGDLGYELAELKGEPGWIGRQAIRAVEASALRAADAVVVRGTSHKRILEDAGLSRVHVIRDGVDVGRGDEADVSRLRRELGLEGALCVGMIGSLRWNRRYRICYGWDLVEAMALLDARLPVRALVVGDGDGLPHLKARAAELGIEGRVRFVGRVPYAELGSYLALMDVAVSTQTNNRVGEVRTTGKLPAYMASGCYVVASDVGEARLLLPPEMRIPYDGVKDDAYPARLAQKITELAGSDRQRRTDATKKTVARARAELVYRYLSSRLEQVLESLLAEPSRPVARKHSADATEAP